MPKKIDKPKRTRSRTMTANPVTGEGLKPAVVMPIQSASASKNPFRAVILLALTLVIAATAVFVSIRIAHMPRVTPGIPETPQDTAFVSIRTHAEFSRWLTEWKRLDPYLTQNEFVKSASGAITLPRPPENAFLPSAADLAEPQAGRYVWSPDRTRFVDYLASYGEPDSLVNVYNRDGRQMIEALAFCGTPCGFDTAFWLDENRVVVLGYSESMDADGLPRCIAQDDPSKCYRLLTATRYDFAAGTQLTYHSADHLFATNPFDAEKKARWEKSVVPVVPTANVTLESPLERGAVGSSFSISGQARTFEQNVRVRVTNVRTGKVLVDDHTTATAPDIGIFGPYIYQAKLAPDAAKPGDSLLVEAFESSAMDGSEINKVSVTVTFQP